MSPKSKAFWPKTLLNSSAVTEMSTTHLSDLVVALR